MIRSVAPKNPFLIPLSLFILIGSLFGAVDARPEASASSAQKPFETITLAVQIVGSAALGSFTDSWEPSAGGRVEFATPAYSGTVQAGVHFFGHDAVSPAVPAFGSTYVYLGWVYRWQLPRSVTCAAGVEMGVSHMAFDEEPTPRARTGETELGFGATSQLTYTFLPRWSLVLTGDYRRVLTKHPIEYAFLGVGLGRTFSTPSWLRELLE